MSATFGIDCSHDYTNEFTTHQIFESKVALLQWIREYIDGKLMKADIREIGIGFVNGNHFVQICFVPGHPLPPVPPNWIHYADNTAKILYQKYQLRFQQYIQLPHPERAANISSKIMVLDDDETAQFSDVLMPSEDTTIHLGDN